jgi:N-acetyl-alpha-D-glucosaminyl L-malate synthase BshA
MKIGITCYPTYGGSGAVATELGIALAQRGHEIHFITYQQPFRLPSFLPRIFFHEVDVGRYPLFEYPPYDLALAVRMHEVVLTHKLDLLHVHYAIPHATSAWIAREMLTSTRPDIKVLTTLHGTDITIVGQDPSFFAITKFSIEKSDGLTAVSQFLRTETQNAFGCTGCRIEVIPNFIDPTVYDRARYTPQLREQAGGRKVLMHVSNFRPVKRVKDVIGIYARVAREIPSVLVMVGDGPDRVEAELEARRLDVADSVFFLGKPEVVRDGETGALCPVGDVEGMARAAIELLRDPERWRAASTLAAADARTRFGMDQVVEQYESFYARALDGTVT